MMNSKFFDSRIRSDRVEKKEIFLGHFFGPVSVILLNAILSGYLNVYYTDVLDISAIWGGLFLAAFPAVAKILDAVTFVLMGRVVDRTRSRQGKARPWIFVCAPIMAVSTVLLFAVPELSENLTAAWIFASYTLFYAVSYTMYSTAHTLIVPLSTHDEDERSKLSLASNTPAMAAGTLVAIIFPCVILPAIGVDRGAWVMVMLIAAAVSLPMILTEYYFTRERVSAADARSAQTVSLGSQLRSCIRSRNWVVLMVYLIVVNIVNSLFGIGAFYYCGWVLGGYNDGFTQALFFAIGQAPLGIGIFLCAPLCRKLGVKNAMIAGFGLSIAGIAVCLAAPRSLPMVLAGQFVRALGLIPSSFMLPSLLGDALDDVERVSGRRCDGFSSAVLNCIVTLSSGAAMCLFNFGLTALGYQAPSESMIPVQNSGVQSFFIFCVIGVQALAYPAIMLLLSLLRNRRNAVPDDAR